MCTRSSHRRRKGTAAATFVIYYGSRQEIENQMNALLDSGAKILQTQMIADYEVSVLFVADYFYSATEPGEADREPESERSEREEPDEADREPESERETVQEEVYQEAQEAESEPDDQVGPLTEEEEEGKFENADLSNAKDIVDPS